MSEKSIGIQAKNMLQNAVLQDINRLFPTSNNPLSLRSKTNVKTRYNKGQLVRLAINGPKHLFIQNYGFEGVKSNGVNMRLKATNVVTSAIERSKVVDYLAEAISSYRADEIVVQLKG